MNKRYPANAVRRRKMLEGIGASALLAPFLNSSLLSSRASAQKAVAGTPTQPDNLLLVTWPCGLEPGWEPIGTGSGYALARNRGIADPNPGPNPNPNPGPNLGPNAYATEPPLQTLVGRHRSKLLIVTGLQSGAVEPASCHSQGPTSMWTGWGGAGLDNAAVSKLPSIDQTIAQRFENPISSLHAGVLVGASEITPRLGLSNYHFTGKGAVEVKDDPQRLYSQIVGTIVQQRTDLRPLQDERSVLDYVLGDIVRLKPRLAVADRGRLDQHLEHIRGLERLLMSGAVTCDAPAVPGAELAGDGAIAGTNGVALTKVHAGLLAWAFSCRLTKVATLQLGRSDCMYTVPYRGASNPVHAAAHGGPIAATTRYVTARYMLDRLGDILDELNAIQVTREQTLLDKTLVVMSSEMGDPTHGVGNVPVFIAGGSFGFFKQGEHIALPGNPRVNKLLVSILRYYGYEDETYGDITTGNFRGVIQELLTST